MLRGDSDAHTHNRICRVGSNRIEREVRVLNALSMLGKSSSSGALFSAPREVVDALRRSDTGAVPGASPDLPVDGAAAGWPDVGAGVDACVWPRHLEELARVPASAHTLEAHASVEERAAAVERAFARTSSSS